MNEYEAMLSILVGVGLAAACGFRVFVPLLVMAIGAKAGHLHLAAGFDWIGSWPAIVAFSLATGLEVAAYYIPWLDNALDTIATPAAVVAGVVVMAAAVTDVSPLLKWSLAVVAGGGAAATVQAATVTGRAGSTAVTGGIANPVLSTLEGVSATVLAVLAIVVPVAAGVLVLGVAGLVVWRLTRRRPVPVVVGRALVPPDA